VSGLAGRFGEALAGDVLGRFIRARPSERRLKSALRRSNGPARARDAGPHRPWLCCGQAYTGADAQRWPDLPLCWIGPAQDAPQVQAGAPCRWYCWISCLLREKSLRMRWTPAGIACAMRSPAPALPAVGGLGCGAGTDGAQPTACRQLAHQRPQAPACLRCPQIGLSLYRAQTRAQTWREPSVETAGEILLAGGARNHPQDRGSVPGLNVGW